MKVDIAQKTLKLIKNKYLITSMIFIVWLLFFDNFNITDRIRDVREINQLEKDSAFYKERIIHDTQRINELQTNKDNLEKFAREQFLMKKENEDIFIIEED